MTQITIQDADLAALIQAAMVTLVKINAAADAITQATPLVQSDVKEAADAVKAAQVNVNDALAALQISVGTIAQAAKDFSVWKH
jgi:hypothetical protein